MKVGDKVKIVIPDGARASAGPAVKTNGKVTTVVKVKQFPGHTSTTALTYYELAGCTSPAGIAYGYTPDWLKKID